MYASVVTSEHCMIFELVVIQYVQRIMYKELGAHHGRRRNFRIEVKTCLNIAIGSKIPVVSMSMISISPAMPATFADVHGTNLYLRR